MVYGIFKTKEMKLTKEILDQIYLGYNYEIKSKTQRDVRVYVQRFGIYYAAEIVPLKEKYNVGKLKKEYSDLGYATKVRYFENETEIEDQLFNEYFLNSPFYHLNKNRYDAFIKRQLENLPEGSKYKFVDIPYDYLIFENEGKLISEGTSSGTETNNLVTHVMNVVNTADLPVFVIVEAAAGFGKTCTAFELLNHFINNQKNLLPFFTELSKDRTARVFKHILWNAIENHFPEGINSRIVIKEIKKGKIPLIIDGFDELLSKDLTEISSSFIETGNMLTTIMDMLKENAKVIITSRKTALFNSDIFHEWAAKADAKFILARFILREPSIGQWISKEKLKLFEKNEYEIDKLANPVLLSYLRNIEPAIIVDLIEDPDNGLFDHYFEFLLNRENVRQNLKFEKDEQMKLFRGLAKFMVGLDFRSDTKQGIKDYFSEYHKNDISTCILRYPIKERPTFEDLIETLSNHVFLDRKENGMIGFLNDFIFGTMVAQGLVFDEYELKMSDSEKEIGAHNCWLAVQAFKINTSTSGKHLWEKLNRSNFNFDDYFYFEMDCFLTRRINRHYQHLQFEHSSFNKINFIGYEFSDILFIGGTFNYCLFDVDYINNIVFQNCKFYDCKTTDSKNWQLTVTFESCKSNNGLEKRFDEVPQTRDSGMSNIDQKHVAPMAILELFFNKPTQTVRHRSARQIESELREADPKYIRKALKELALEGLILPTGEMFFISKKGIKFYFKTKTNI